MEMTNLTVTDGIPESIIDTYIDELFCNTHLQNDRYKLPSNNQCNKIREPETLTDLNNSNCNASFSSHDENTLTASYDSFKNCGKDAKKVFHWDEDKERIDGVKSKPITVVTNSTKYHKKVPDLVCSSKRGSDIKYSGKIGLDLVCSSRKNQAKTGSDLMCSNRKNQAKTGSDLVCSNRKNQAKTGSDLMCSNRKNQTKTGSDLVCSGRRKPQSASEKTQIKFGEGKEVGNYEGVCQFETPLNNAVLTLSGASTLEKSVTDLRTKKDHSATPSTDLVPSSRRKCNSSSKIDSPVDISHSYRHSTANTDSSFETSSAFENSSCVSIDETHLYEKQSCNLQQSQTSVLKNLVDLKPSSRCSRNASDFKGELRQKDRSTKLLQQEMDGFNSDTDRELSSTLANSEGNSDLITTYTMSTNNSSTRCSTRNKTVETKQLISNSKECNIFKSKFKNYKQVANNKDKKECEQKDKKMSNEMRKRERHCSGSESLGLPVKIRKLKEKVNFEKISSTVKAEIQFSSNKKKKRKVSRRNSYPAICHKKLNSKNNSQIRKSFNGITGNFSMSTCASTSILNKSCSESQVQHERKCNNLKRDQHFTVDKKQDIIQKVHRRIAKMNEKSTATLTTHAYKTAKTDQEKQTDEVDLSELETIIPLDKEYKDNDRKAKQKLDASRVLIQRHTTRGIWESLVSKYV